MTINIKLLQILQAVTDLGTELEHYERITTELEQDCTHYRNSLIEVEQKLDATEKLLLGANEEIEAARALIIELERTVECNEAALAERGRTIDRINSNLAAATKGANSKAKKAIAMELAPEPEPESEPVPKLKLNYYFHIQTGVAGGSDPRTPIVEVTAEECKASSSSDYFSYHESPHTAATRPLQDLVSAWTPNLYKFSFRLKADVQAYESAVAALFGGTAGY